MELEAVRHLARCALQNPRSAPSSDRRPERLPRTRRRHGHEPHAHAAIHRRGAGKLERRFERSGREGRHSGRAHGRTRQLGCHLLPDRAGVRRRSRQDERRLDTAAPPCVSQCQRRRLPGGQAPGRGDDLTVIREMAEEERGRRTGGCRPRSSWPRSLARGEDALARTPEMLDVLRNAGVVDAGGAGLVEIARGMVYGASGQPLPDARRRRDAELRGDPSGALEVPLLHRLRGRGRGPRPGRSRGDARADGRLVAGRRRHERAQGASSYGQSWRGDLGRDDAGVVEAVEIANMHHQTAQREDRLLESAGTSLPTLETGLVAVCPGAATAVSSKASARRGSSKAGRP